MTPAYLTGWTSPAGAPRPGSVVACVLTYNAARWIRTCLSTLLASDWPDLEVLVIDNASAEGTAELVRTHFPAVPLLANRWNLGCAAGNNLGLRWAFNRGTEFALVLNPDTKVAPDAVRRLLDAARTHPDFGVLSPVQTDYDGRSLDPFFAWYLRSNDLSEDAVAPGGVDDVVEVHGGGGAAMLLRMAMFHHWRLGVVSQARIAHWHRHRQARGVKARRLEPVRELTLRAEYIAGVKDLRLTARQLLVAQWFLLTHVAAIERHVRAERRGAVPPPAPNP